MASQSTGPASPTATKKLLKKKTTQIPKASFHLVTNFEEIGWFDPYEARKPNKKAELMP